MTKLYTFLKYHKSLPIGILLSVTILNVNAQVKIGTNGTVIAPASLLELESANQGLLLPRLSDTMAINALTPPNGMLIYLTKAPAVGLYVRKVPGWEFLSGSLGGNGNFNSLTIAGSVTAGSFSGPLTGNATSATIATTATNSINSGITNDLTTTTVTYPTFVTNTPGNLPLRTSNTNLSFVPSTGILTAKGFVGPLTGNVTGTATLAIDATNAANAGITNDVTTNALHYPTFVSGTTGNLPQKTSNTNLTFNPNTGILTATGFSGNLTGNSSSATNALTTTITDDITTAIPTYPTFVTATTGNWGQRTSSSKLNYVPLTGVLTASGFTSTIPTGTAPFVVASSTPVANLSATNSANVTITDDVSTPTPTYPTFVLATAGNMGPRTSSSRLSYIPSTGILSAAGFTSTVATGTAPFVVASTTPVLNLTATNSTNVAITDDLATVTPVFPTFVTANTGNLPQRTSSARLSYIPATGVLTSTRFTSTVATGTAPFTVTSTTPVANLSIGGNAATASALAIPRTINGVNFDGTANVTVTAAAGTLTGATLATNVVASSLTQVGTIALGTWNAGAVSTTQLSGKTAIPPPTLTAGAGAGTTPPVLAITGTDVAGQITITIGTLPAPGSTLVTVNYLVPFPTTSFPVLYPANLNAASVSQLNGIFATGLNGSFSISAGSGSLVAGTTYSWNYHVIGH